MKEIIAKISTKQIEEELEKVRFVRETNKGNNKIYSFNYHTSPVLMQEIGRLREITFRNAGGGTGKSADIDDFDTAKIPYEQLIVWDSDNEDIIGGYRYLLCANAPLDKDGNIVTATSRLFDYSQDFVNNYFPYTIELGRSFVQPAYQSTKVGRKALFALDNLWDGLGAIVVDNPHMKYFFGKVTMYPHFNTKARNLILYFIKKYFKDDSNLIKLKDPLELGIDYNKMKQIFTGNNYVEDQKILSAEVRALGENVPPLINAYMNLSSTMKTFGTSINSHFGNVEETGILLTIKDIYESKKERHLNTYKKSMS